MAVANYESTKEHLPPPYLPGPDGRPGHSWRALILPYLSFDHLFNQYAFDQPWDGPSNGVLATQMPRLYAVYGDYKPGTVITNYLAIVGQNTVWRPDKRVVGKDIKDGCANTILIPENRGLNIHWLEPRDFDFATMDWTINSPRGISSKYDAPAAVFLDASVRRLSPAMSPETLRALATMDGGEDLIGGYDGDWQVLPDGRNRPVVNPER